MSPAFVRVNPGDPVQAQNLDQVIDALNGTTAKGVPIAVTAVNDTSNYALTVQNVEPTSSRALNVLNSGGTSMVRVDSSGVTLGSPLNLAASSITTPAIANGAVTNAKLASDTARANLLTNGGFEIWQRGSGPFAAMNLWTADRWQIVGSAGDTVSVSRNTATVDNGSTACAAVTFTKGTGSTSLGQNVVLSDFSQLLGRTVSCSVRVRTSTAGAVSLNYYNGTAWTASAFHTGDNTYQTLTLSGITVGGTYNQFAINFVASCTAYIDNATLVVGSVPADYAPLHPADDLARCQRYYEIVGETVMEIDFQGYGAAGGGATMLLAYKARKPVAPTCTKNGTWGVVNAAQPIVTTGAAGYLPMRTVVTALGGFAVQNSGAGQNFTAEANP